MKKALKPLSWIGSSYRDYKAFPDDVQDEMGFALFIAQTGDRHPSAKPLKGFRGAGVLELVEYHDGNTYRAVYAVHFAEEVYVLHAFQKKSKRGRATPKRDSELIKQRLQAAEADYRKRYAAL